METVLEQGGIHGILVFPIVKSILRLSEVKWYRYSTSLALLVN